MTGAAGLALWTLLLAANLDSRCSLVLIPEGAPVKKVEAPCSQLDRYQEGLYAGWIWNRLQTPVRFTGSEAFDWAASADSRRHLRVALVEGLGTQKRPARLLSAPTRMWEEVPESFLPAWPIGDGGLAEIPVDPATPWRLRVLDGDRGTWWTDRESASGTARMAASPAASLEIEIVDSGGVPIENAVVRILEPAAGLAEARILAYYQGDARGRVVIASVPTDHVAALLVAGRSSVPRLLEGALSSLPLRIALDPAAALSGRFVADDGSPVPGVEVLLRSWLPGGAAMTYGLAATSDDDGRWSHPGVPPGEVAVLALKKGYGRLRRTLHVDRPATDLGDLVLRRGSELEIRVVDETGLPIPGAKIATDTGSGVSTDAQGLAVLEDLEPGSSLRLSASATGHSDRERSIAVDFATARIDLTLPRAHGVVGRMVDDEGVPVAGGSIRTVAGSTTDDRAAGPDGRFEVWLEARRPATLALSSRRSIEIELAVAGGEPGSITDLGDIALPAGTTVTGRVLDDNSGLPVAGARIWAPRVGVRGPIVAWAHGDLLEDRTDADGSFHLTGVTRQPGLLRVEALGYARRHLALSWTDGFDDQVDLGEIYVSPGVTLVVQVDPPPEDAADLRVDLRNQWLEPDMLRASVVAGSATVGHVPPGPVTLTVISGRDLLCVREVEVPDDGDTFETSCEAESHTVDGVVMRAGRPLGPGRLVWNPPSPGVMATIVRREELGLAHSTTFGGGRPSVTTPVAPDGSFSSTRLTPGVWQVLWSSASETPGAPVEVQLRDEPRQEVTIALPGGVVRGRVTDTEGNAVAAARVRLTPGGALAFADADGEFEIGGVAAGMAFVRARMGDRFSDTVEVQLIDGIAADPILLVLRDDAEPGSRFRVLQDDGTPAVAALLFVEDDRGRWRVLTTDRDGTAARPAKMPPATRHRVAVLHQGRWTLGGWASTGENPEIVLDDRDSAQLRIRTDHSLEGPVRILGPHSWEVSWVLARAGLRPVIRPGSDFEIAGLPPGTYSISAGTTSATIVLSPGENGEVLLD